MTWYLYHLEFHFELMIPKLARSKIMPPLNVHVALHFLYTQFTMLYYLNKNNIKKYPAMVAWG